MRKLLPILLATLCVTCAAPIALARSHGDEGASGQSQARISLDQAVAMAERRYHAKVVRTERTERDGHVIYVLRLLDNASGRVWTVQVDASTGSMS